VFAIKGAKQQKFPLERSSPEKTQKTETMQAALRLARHHPHRALSRSVRCLATAANPSAHVGTDGASASGASASVRPASAVPLSNVEAAWTKMSDVEKLSIQEQLEEIQKRDWNTLSIDEKKAGALWFLLVRVLGLLIIWRAFYFLLSFLTAYYVAFGPHGPRTPTSQPGDGVKIFFWTMALVGVAGVLTVGIRSLGVYSSPVLFWIARVDKGSCLQLLLLQRLCQESGRRLRTPER